ncbi:amylo-alpha-1,6-glucosidase [Agromyces mangrovi Wang et al. 2018]|uniref:amylo-alpha-1,6-glucosidase n=1 Tax=Agromyces mangrovi TaxID=1858653 RepID=UPI0025736D2F|nr:glycogen debranching protein [Agromyces mangrovi]
MREIPFSRRGSWLNLSPVTGLHRRADDIHLISHVTGMHAVLKLIPTRGGKRLETLVTSDPSVLTWDCGDSTRVRAAFKSTSIVRIAGDGADLEVSDAADELTPFTGTYFFKDPIDGSYVFTSYETGRRYRVNALRGTLEATGTEALGAGTRSLTASGDAGWEIAIEEIDAARTPYASIERFDDVVTRAADDFTTYLDTIAGWRTDATPAVALATYVLWSATVEPAGFLRRESILMSKHWMDKVWSWDHAFNALALAPGLPDLALDQFFAPFDLQDESGAMPDSVTHSEVLYNFVKPPIHGWAFSRLRERSPRALSRDELVEAYERLSKWTRFWLDYRTAPGHELPYYQHGNDSGWDNSTTFDTDRVIESPELAAFLLVQLGVLADLADELALDGADEWRATRARLRAALLAQLSDNEGFFAVGALSGARSKRTSLLNLLPVLAADAFPRELLDVLARGIGAHLTEWGPATQLLDTKEYEPDGYWRGPIWAPSTMLIEDGLRRSGYDTLADEVSSRFRRLCERSGFAENFDAITGEGLRDRAYTWTASVYLVFAHETTLRSNATQDAVVDSSAAD